MRRPRQLGVLALALVLLPAVAACGGDDADSSAIVGDLTISNARARFLAPGVPGAIYLEIVNDGGSPDALVGASSNIARATQVHQTVTEGGSSRMQPVDRLPVPAEGSVSLRPGGYHIMLMGVDSPPAVGETFALTLSFERAGDVTVEVEVVEPSAIDGVSGGN